MCMKLSPGDLNSDPYPPHPTSTYTCGVTTAPRVRGGQTKLIINVRNLTLFVKFLQTKLMSIT